MNVAILLRQCLPKLLLVLAPFFPLISHADTATTTNDTALTAYKVQKGDTLMGVANRFNLTPAQLASYNNKQATDKLIIGETLLLSGDDVAKVVSKIKPDALNYVSPTTFIYTIKAGETINGIANRNDTTPSEILRLNNLKIEDKLAIGQKLKLPISSKSAVKPSDKAPTKEATAKQAVVKEVTKDTAKATPAPIVKTTTIIVTETKGEAKPAETKTVTKPKATVKITEYSVVSGDSLGKLSARYNIAVSDLAKMNKLKPTDSLKIGQQILVPVAVVNSSGDKK